MNLISQVEQIYVSDLGEPDCKLINPCIIEKDITQKHQIKRWLNDFTEDKALLISSDKILTLVQPSKFFIDQYLEIIK